MTCSNKTLGLILLASTALNLTRLLPIFIHPDIGFHNFPPIETDHTLLITSIPGWFLSHLMGLLSVPLLIVGLIIIYGKVSDGNNAPSEQCPLWLCALVFIGIGMFFYSIAVGVDGWVLPQVANQYLQATSSSLLKDSLEASMVSTHNLALSFGGMALAVLPIGAGLIGIVMRDYSKLRVLGSISIGYAIIAIVSLCLGIADIAMHKNFLFTAGLIFAPQLIFFLLAILLLNEEDLLTSKS